MTKSPLSTNLLRSSQAVDMSIRSRHIFSAALRRAWSTARKRMPEIDVTPAELDRIQRRAAMRQQLKSDFNRKFYNPLKHVYHVELMDPAVQRYMAAKASRYDYWKPHWSGFFWFFGINIVPIFVYGKYLEVSRAERERQFRNGEVSYRDRKNKWTWVSSQI